MQTETNIPYKEMCVQLKNSMYLQHLRRGVPETNSVKGVPSVTGREITSAATKSNAESWPGLARHCLVKSNLLIVVSLELQKHHATYSTCISSTTKFGVV